MRRLSVISGALLLTLGLAACGSDDSDGDDSATDGAGSGATSSETPEEDTPESTGSSDGGGGAAQGECEYPEDGTEPARPVDPPPAEPEVDGEVAATLTLNGDPVPLTLDAGAAPCTVNSFVSLAEQGYFDDTVCHRITTDGIFVLQCGDPTEDPALRGTGGPGYSFADEVSGDETYGRGTLAMANAGPDTNGSQFFMVYDESPLPPAYTVFGSIEDTGLEVVDQVAEAGAEGGAPDGPPAEDAAVESVSVD